MCAQLTDLLYDGGNGSNDCNGNMCMSVLVADLDMIMLPPTMCYDQRALLIFDKLMIHDAINATVNTISENTQIGTPYVIINHTLDVRTIVTAYAHDIHILYNNAISIPIIAANTTITDIIASKMHIKKVTILTNGVTNEDMCPYTNLEELHVNYKRNDGEIVGRNNRITTCAQTVRILSAHGTCGISDASVQSCTLIQKLYVCNNEKITTCAPFATTLQILNASCTCGISDDGLRTCTMIHTLNASNNIKITTCVPFASSLRILSAYESCGISDNGLRTCRSISHIVIA